MNDYVESVVKELVDMGYDAQVKEVEKANGIKAIGIAMRFDEHLGMVVYPNLDENIDAHQTAMACVELFNKHKIDDNNRVNNIMDELRNYESVKPRLSVSLFNKSTNAEISRSCKRYGLDDVIMVPIIEVTMDKLYEGGTIRIEQKFLDMWGVDKRTVFKDALANVKKEKAVITSLTEYIHMPSFYEDLLPGIVVVTNENAMYGSRVILGVLPKLRRRYPNGFYVIPSSIHELIVCPKDFMESSMDISCITEMVKAVNSEVVLPEEVLGGHAYEF